MSLPVDRPPLSCHEQVCITCSDEAVAVRVIQLLDDGLALVEATSRDNAGTGRGAGVEEVSVALVEVAVGDTVLVHAKEAIAVVKDGLR